MSSFLGRVWEGLQGQVDLGDVREDIAEFRPEQIDVGGVLGRIAPLDLSGMEEGRAALQDVISRLLERSTLDQSGVFRQGLRQDIGAFNLAQRAQLRGDVAAAGISPTLGAAAGRAGTASALGTIGQAVGQFRLGQTGQQLEALQSALGGAASLGQLGLGAGELQLGQGRLIGGISSDIARANLASQTQFGMFGAGELTGARQQNVANRAQAIAGLISAGASIAGGVIGAVGGVAQAGRLAQGAGQQTPMFFNPLGSQQQSNPAMNLNIMQQGLGF